MCETETKKSDFKPIRGEIYGWEKSIAEIPDGWALCDGNNGTPDLRDKGDLDVYIIKL